MSNGTFTTDGWSLHTITFLDGRALFFNGVFRHSYDFFTDFADDYGILPYPKWNEEQEQYYTMADGSAPLAAVPTTIKDTEFVGIITEALAAESWKIVIPTVYDVALKVRGVRDEQSMHIVDIIANSAVFDFGFIYADASTGDMGFALSTLMKFKNKDFASFYASNKNSWIAKLESVVNAFLN